MTRQMNSFEKESLKAFNNQLEISFGLTAEEVSSKDFMGFIWFEIFKNGKPTGNFVTAKDANHAIKIYKEFY